MTQPRFALSFLFAFGFSILTGLAQPVRRPAELPKPVPNQIPSPSPVPAHPLAWDAMTKEYATKAGESSHQFIFSVTNTATTNVTITAVMPSCGCTVATLPSQPWILVPGTNGQIQATVNFAGKSGQLTKLLTVVSTAGQQTLTLKLNVAADASAINRQQNMMAAINDRQAVFKNDCATCHVANGQGKMGESLFTADCAICHDSPHRAEMVTDLTKLQHPADLAFWKKMITEGKEHSLMPAFAKEKGGPLTDEEINSIAEFAMKRFPFNPANVKPRSITF